MCMSKTASVGVRHSESETSDALLVRLGVGAGEAGGEMDGKEIFWAGIARGEKGTASRLRCDFISIEGWVVFEWLKGLWRFGGEK